MKTHKACVKRRVIGTRELIKKARSGDPEAFIALIDAHRQSMYKVARGFFNEPMDIEDALSDTVISCWEHLSKLKRRETFKTWLIRILINKCNDIKRRNRNLVSLELIGETAATSPGPGDTDFETLISALSPAYRAVIVLHYSEGYKAREIADMLGLPVGTVTSRLKRGREQLAGILEGKECV